MNALELLKQDHSRITKLFAEATTYDNMKRLFETIRNALEIHTYIEKRLFYPKLQNWDKLKELVEDAKKQHDLINQLLDEMKHQQAQEFEKSFKTLKAEVQLYITSEENEIFPQVESLKSPNLAQLGDEMETAKVEYQTARRSDPPAEVRRRQ